MKNEKKIVYEESAEMKQAKGWVCKTCTRFWGEDEHMARWCCATDFQCQMDGCENRVGKIWIHCEECRKKNDVVAEEKRFNDAELVEDYDGPFFIDNRFCMDADEYLDEVRCGDVFPQEFAFVPVIVIPSVDADEIWTSALERAEIDMDCFFEAEGMAEFELAVKKFNEENAKEVHYYQNHYGKKFRLPIWEGDEDEKKNTKSETS